MKQSIRRKPQIQNPEERLAFAEKKFQDEGPAYLEKLHQDIVNLRTMIAEQGLDGSKGKAEALVDALRAQL